jgi:putative tricarboxylic transport membrane protein
MIQEAFFGALSNLLTLNYLLYMLIGVTVGLVVGILPALGGIAGMSLLLPFIYGMDVTAALAMLMGMVAVIPTSDTFSSVLMGIPGSASAQATVLDGFPLAKRGEAARALSAAFSASFVGGMFGAAILTVFVLVARPLIVSFGSAELFMLAIFGLSMVGVLSGSNLAKGLAACAIGLTVGAVGAAPATGEFRMAFGSLYLSNGLPLTIIALGLFAIPEIVDILRTQVTIAGEGKLGRGWLDGVRDTWRNIGLTLRCSGIGAVLGVLPGIGGSASDWIVYGHVVQSAKDKSQFGKGDIRGVIGPESANNSKDGGALVPTLLFGIPGGGTMAIFLAGMVLLGLQPGPTMVGRSLDITYTIVWSLAMANVMGTVLCISLSPTIARLTTVRFSVLAPFMVMIISFGAFQATRSLYDLLALLALGVLGIFMRRFGWSRPAFLIGFVLATMSERYLYQAVQFYGWVFLTRPLVIAIGVLTLVSVWFSARGRKLVGKTLETEGDPEKAHASRMWPQVAFSVAVLGLFAFAFSESWPKSFIGGIFPLVVSIAGTVLTLIVLVSQLRGPDTNANFDAEVAPRVEGDPGPWHYLAWLVGFIAAVALIGFFASLLLFFVAFLRVVARTSWLTTLALTAGAAIFILILAQALNLVFPGGVLQAYFDLPWPFR